MPASDKPHSRYMPGLDGLRALALIGVMGYHWNFGFAGGGFRSQFILRTVRLSHYGYSGIAMASSSPDRSERLLDPKVPTSPAGHAAHAVHPGGVGYAI